MKWDEMRKRKVNDVSQTGTADIQFVFFANKHMLVVFVTKKNLANEFARKNNCSNGKLFRKNKSHFKIRKKNEADSPEEFLTFSLYIYINYI